MKTISFVNPNYRLGPRHINAYFLPYTSGLLWSYVSSFDNIRENYQLGEFIWRREPIEQVVDRIASHDIIGFSSYVWNRNYNYKLAELLKKRNPNVKIIFGGPDPPLTDPDIFKRLPFIDMCVKIEGEIVLKRILQGDNLHEIPGLLINQQGEAIDTGAAERIADLDQIPSPYLAGIFDHLFEQNPDVKWNAVFESNRGCPYACTFCDWGSLTYNKIKKFKLERAVAELEWFGSHGIEFLSIADANFGIFVERDSIIADTLARVQEKYGCPYGYTISWAKNQRKETVDMVRRLMKINNRVGVNISVQTLTDSVLENIKRDNMEINQIKEMFDECDKQGIPLYTEIILGLPGESLQTWKENFYKLYRYGNHTGIKVYIASLLENAEMNLLQRRLFGMKTVKALDNIANSSVRDEITETTEVTIATKSMPEDDFIKAWMFSWLQTTFHINGITNWVARFLEKNNVPYEEFYEKLYKFLSQDTWWKQEIKHVSASFKTWTKQGYITHDELAGIEINGPSLMHSTVLKLHNENRLQDALDLIENFLSKTWNFDGKIISQLMTFQRNFTINWHQLHTYPRTIEFDYDFLGFIQYQKNLDTPITLQFNFSADENVELFKFVANIYYARRGEYGKARITKLK